jgi:hypothetical protein
MVVQALVTPGSEPATELLPSLLPGLLPRPATGACYRAATRPATEPATEPASSASQIHVSSSSSVMDRVFAVATETHVLWMSWSA